MKAIRVHEFGDPEVLRIEEVPVPRLEKDEVLVRVGAAGVNPYEAYIRAGQYDRLPELPYTPGSDAAGTVESVGAGVELPIGTRVFTTGTLTGAYAEFAKCRIEQLQLLPERVSYAQGASLYVPYATAYRGLFQLARARPGETVLIHGASGGVGIAAVQWARAAGLRVFATAGSAQGLKLVADQGAEHCFDHRAPDHCDEIVEATGGRGIDIVLEMLANVNLGRDMKLVAQRGRIVVIGSRGEVQVNPRDLMTREAQIKGCRLSGASAGEMAENHAALSAGLDNGFLQPVVGLKLPLASAAEAHARLMEGGASGKIILIP